VNAAAYDKPLYPSVKHIQSSKVLKTLIACKSSLDFINEAKIWCVDWKQIIYYN